MAKPGTGIPYEMNARSLSGWEPVAFQPDLFSMPRLSGLDQADAIVSPDEEKTLIAAIDACDLSPFRFQGWLGKRLTASFGWHYDFDTASFTEARAMPPWLLPVREAAARFAGFPGRRLRSSPGDPIRSRGWDRLA